jgi:uncharacterized protein (DUF2249 family)
VSAEQNGVAASTVAASTVAALTKVLVRACRKLGEAGRPQEAGRLAADAWVAVRSHYPRQAEHLDGVMHHTARLEQQQAERDQSAGTVNWKDHTVPADDQTTQDQVLDVRTEIPRRRHELIFEAFSDLAPGAAYVLVNDHDPKPLRYQFEAENAGEFTWEYLEEGPDVWRVRIGRTAAAGGTPA